MVSDLQPGVSQRFAHGESTSHRHLQQVVDETHSCRGRKGDKDQFLQQISWDQTQVVVITFQWYEGPGLARVHEGGVGYLLPDVLVLVEGERAAQADVHDDAHRPHVQRAVVAAVADHLGRQVGWGPHYRATERPLADDAGETEVAQLHLRKACKWIGCEVRPDACSEPKRRNPTWGRGSAEASSTFSGFRSQWAICFRCRYRKASRICSRSIRNTRS